MKALVGGFNKKKALEGAFFGHCEISRSPVTSSSMWRHCLVEWSPSPASASDRVHDECRRSPGLRCHAAAHGAGKVKATSGSITSAEIHIRCRGQNNKSVHTAHHCALCLLLGVLQIVDSVDSVLPV